jgi:hypothetical protein
MMGVLCMLVGNQYSSDALYLLNMLNVGYLGFLGLWRPG